MDWNIRWFFLCGIAYLFLMVNLSRSLTGKYRGWKVLSFCSLSFGILTVLDQYRMINHWLAWEEINSILNVVPSVAHTLTITMWGLIILNLIVLIINLKRNT